MSVFGLGLHRGMIDVPYRTNSWIGIGTTVALASAALTADVVSFMPIPIRWPVTVDTLQFNNAGSVAGNALFGLYSNLAGGFGPDGLIAECNAVVDTSIVAAAAVGFAVNPRLRPPLVWCAILPSAAAQFSSYPANGLSPSYAAEIIGGAAGSFVTSSVATGRILRAQLAAAYAGGLPASAAGHTWAVSTSAPAPTLKAIS